jgi:hypothetical protein
MTNPTLPRYCLESSKIEQLTVGKSAIFSGILVPHRSRRWIVLTVTLKGGLIASRRTLTELYEVSIITAADCPLGPRRLDLLETFRE